MNEVSEKVLAEEMRRAVWRDDLQASVLGLTYDFGRRLGMLHLPPGGAVDVSGTIALFCGIDPDVELICTVVGTQQGTAYRRTGVEWRVYPIHAVPVQ